MTTPLRKMRKHRTDTLVDAAKAIGLSPASLSKIERGQQQPSIETVDRIVSYYGHPLTELHILYPERYADFDPGAPSQTGQKLEEGKSHGRSTDRRKRDRRRSRGAREDDSR